MLDDWLSDVGENEEGRCCALYKVKGNFRREKTIIINIYKEMYITRGLCPATSSCKSLNNSVAKKSSKII
jgi:hypothetical protein